ncbi:hypothetical protein EYF80_047971 [Liparis tanakae]|uniref:Secreted protein n=1 Tax=Liparis tanakae TaxID=230148 RepID=A0A4Z2FM54_9TELE|nr:hypothetical protein EYF80_047971 [Liparis tanakae]
MSPRRISALALLLTLQLGKTPFSRETLRKRPGSTYRLFPEPTPPNTPLPDVNGRPRGHRRVNEKCRFISSLSPCLALPVRS